MKLVTFYKLVTRGGRFVEGPFHDFDIAMAALEAHSRDRYARIEKVSFYVSETYVEYEDSLGTTRKT